MGAISAVSREYSRDDLLSLRSNVGEAITRIDLTEIETFCQPIEDNNSEKTCWPATVHSTTDGSEVGEVDCWSSYAIGSGMVIASDES